METVSLKKYLGRASPSNFLPYLPGVSINVGMSLALSEVHFDFGSSYTKPVGCCLLTVPQRRWTWRQKTLRETDKMRLFTPNI